MKKSVLALAVLGAFAGVASAQSSVTMFGVVDLNVQTVSNNERVYGMSTDGMSSSRLGFRGVEDLGGGLKAGFWLEMGLAADTGKSNSNGNWGSGRCQRCRAVLQPPFDGQPVEPVGRTAPRPRLHRRRSGTGRCSIRSAPTASAPPPTWHSAAICRPRWRALPTARWSVPTTWCSTSCRPACSARPVRSGADGRRRRRPGQQVLGWPHRLRRGSVRRRRLPTATPDCLDLALQHRPGQLEHRLVRGTSVS